MELMRIAAICGVVVLHFNGYGGFEYVQPGSVNYWLLLILESLCICAVDLFILISGFFLCRTGKRRVAKALELVIQVMVIGLVRYLLGCLLGEESFRVQSVIGAMIPNNYFVTMYLAVYFLSPYLNILLDKLSEQQFRNLLVLWLILFSLWPTALDILSEGAGKWYPGMYPAGTAGSQYGYNIVNFLTMYLIGAYLYRRGGRLSLFSEGKMVGALIVCVTLLTLLQLVCPQTARSYCNPLVIILAVLVFLLLQQIKLQSRMINHLAKSALTCFLFHDFLLPYLVSEAIVTGNPLIMLIHIFLSAVGLYLLCWVVWFLYETLSKPLRRLLEKLTEKTDSVVSV